MLIRKYTNMDIILENMVKLKISSEDVDEYNILIDIIHRYDYITSTDDVNILLTDVYLLINRYKHTWVDYTFRTLSEKDSNIHIKLIPSIKNKIDYFIFKYGVSSNYLELLNVSLEIFKLIKECADYIHPDIESLTLNFLKITTN